MPSGRAFLLSSRGFWAITLAFCAVEMAIVAFAYQRNTEQHQLAEQVALVRESTTVVWHLSSRSGASSGTEVAAPPALPAQHHAWLTSVLQTLRTGGVVHALDSTAARLLPVESTDARLALTDAIVRWSSFSRLNARQPGSDAANDELRALAATLSGLGVLLAEKRDIAGREAMLLVVLAIGSCVAGFLTIGTLLLRQTRRFERSGRLMRSMMNQIGAGVCILGSTDKIADANRAPAGCSAARAVTCAGGVLATS